MESRNTNGWMERWGQLIEDRLRSFQAHIKECHDETNLLRSVMREDTRQLWDKIGQLEADRISKLEERITANERSIDKLVVKIGFIGAIAGGIAGGLSYAVQLISG